MQLRKAAMNTVIILYLFCTTCALVFTTTRIQIVPTKYVHYFYGMMAPFQSYSTDHIELFAEGKTDEGYWEQIEMKKYFPVSYGEYTYRLYMMTSRERGSDLATLHYNRLQELLQRKEGYRDVRLFMHVWPRSPQGVYANYRTDAVRKIPPMEL